MKPKLEGLSDLVGDYLRVRRALGYKLESTERTLDSFIVYLREHDADRVAVAHAVGRSVSNQLRRAVVG